MKFLIHSLYAILISGLMTFSAFAGVRDVGNPGKGVFVDEKLVLLDLYEAGVLNPTIDRTVIPAAVYLARAQRLSFLTQEEAMLLAIKLTELRTLSPFLADSMAVGSNLYVWRLLEQKLVNIRERSPVALPGKSVQLATRLGGMIRISREAWEQLSAENRVALVIHELLMALSPSMFERKIAMDTDSFRVRQIVGYLFMPELKNRGVDGFETFSGIRSELSKIVDENMILKVSDISAVYETELERIYFNILGLNNLFEKEVFCQKVVSKSNNLLSFIYRTQAVVYRFDVFRTVYGYQNGLKIDSDKPSVPSVIPLTTHALSEGDVAECKNTMDQVQTHVYQKFGY